MDNIRNPFAPGAGNRPPELSGRSQLIDNTDVAIQRIAQLYYVIFGYRTDG